MVAPLVEHDRGVNADDTGPVEASPFRKVRKSGLGEAVLDGDPGHKLTPCDVFRGISILIQHLLEDLDHIAQIQDHALVQIVVAVVVVEVEAFRNHHIDQVTWHVALAAVGPLLDDQADRKLIFADH